jgi:hypothetical protein
MLTRTQWIEQFKADLRDYRNAVCDFMMWGNSEEAVAATHSKVVCRVLTLANRVTDWPTTTDAQTNRLLSAIESAPANPIKALCAGVVDGDPLADESGFSAGAGRTVYYVIGGDIYKPDRGRWMRLDKTTREWRDAEDIGWIAEQLSNGSAHKCRDIYECFAAVTEPPAVDPTTDPERFCEFTGPCDGEAR